MILSIKNKNKIFNVKVKYKGVTKVKSNTLLDGISAGEIVVNGKKFSESIYNKKGVTEAEIAKFIRDNSLLQKRSFIVTSKENPETKGYDVYMLDPIPPKISDGLDALYIQTAILKQQKTIPGRKKERNISLKKLRVLEHISEEQIAKIKEVIHNESDPNKWKKMFNEEEIENFKATVDHLHQYEYTIIPGATTEEKEFVRFLKTFEITNLDIYDKLDKYYINTLSNKEIYSKISCLNMLVYHKPLNLIQSDQNKKKTKVINFSNRKGEQSEEKTA